ncbi:MAG: translation initiation factor IF-2, partial [Caulobacteraceae bacterium]
APGKALSRTKGAPQRREGRLTIQAVAGDGDTAERMRSLASVRRAREREREKRTKGAGGPEQGARAREVIIPDAITVQDLAQRMAIRAGDVIKYLMRQGTMLTLNDVLDADTAELIASEFGHTVKRVSESDVETGFLAEEDHADDTTPRPPVVTVMGHVDHGKTSLLDALRSADVAGGEHGGITQHIGAYQVRMANGQAVTFLDTPGHAAFSAMRARGANVTDIVVLVVAADDGVMPQTIEAINHAKAANAPIIVAINKIDKPDANPQQIINELLQHEIVVESLGGETQAIEVSATKKLGLENLIEAISLQAEVMDLRANPDRSPEGVVIEAKLDKGRGPVASVLVQRGTLKRGEIIVAGQAWGRVRALVNDRGEQVPQAGPSEPVEILGLDQAPSPGEPFAIVENEARARELTEYRARQRREKQIGAGVGSTSLAEMMAKLQNKQVKELALVIKGDVQGSTEAIIGSLEKLGNEEVRARIIHSGVGAITESDVQLAKGSGAPIIGFNVRASKQARDLAEREGVEIRYYAIIYDLIDDIKGVLSGMLAPMQRETWLGNATVLEVFNITKVGNVAGCRVTEGVVRRGAKIRVIRNDIVVQEMGTLHTLRRFKDDVAEVTSGYECGMNYANQDIKPGDVIECFSVETVARSL